MTTTLATRVRKPGRSRRIVAGALAAGAAALGAGLLTASPAAADGFNVYELGSINGVQAFGIGPFGSAGACHDHSDTLKDWGQSVSPKFGTCVYDPGVGGWLLISRYAN